MKTIEESAKEYAKEVFEGIECDTDFFTEEDIKRAVLHGVELAQRFIPVEEETYPQNKQILVKTYNGSIYDVCYIGDRLISWWGANSFEVYKSTVVEWRPIELK